VLNAKQHAREAEIVAQAGRPKMITIATNMAGRGTDIVLGGNVEKQIDLLPLRRMPDERARARVAELRGRVAEAARPGDRRRRPAHHRHRAPRVAPHRQPAARPLRPPGRPGLSRFYLSLEDPLLRIFAGERLNAIMDRLKMPEGEAIEHPMVTRSIESAQRKVEARNFDIRKQLLEYDDVANDQRKVIYQQRNELLEATTSPRPITAMRQGVLTTSSAARAAESVEEQWDVAGLQTGARRPTSSSVPTAEWLKASRTRPTTTDRCARASRRPTSAYAAKVALVGDRAASASSSATSCCRALDQHWREHLAALDHLRQGIHLRGYAQKNPKQEYKREAFELFESLMQTRVRNDVTKLLMTSRMPPLENVQYQHADYDEALGSLVRAWSRKAAAPGAPGREDRPQRPLSLRLGQEVQALPRQAQLTRSRRPCRSI
jgi:preprotein translocase subunit SecA